MDFTEVTKDDTFFIHCLYGRILNREPDPEGLKYWEEYEPKGNLVAAFMAAAQRELDGRAA